MEQRVIHVSHHPRNQLPHVQTGRRSSVSHVRAILRPDGKESGEPRKGKRANKEGWEGKETGEGRADKEKEETSTVHKCRKDAGEH